MTRPVAVLGIGQSRIAAARTDVSLQELIFECSSAALADAGLAREEIDSVVLSANDLVDGRGIASMSSAPAAGAYMKHETRTTNDGLYAVILACMEILAGRSRVVLVMSWNKISESEWPAASPASVEPLFTRPLGVDGDAVLGLEAASLLLSGRADRDLVARAAERNRRNAAANSRHAARATPAGDSPSRMWPLREDDLPQASDGAFGMVLADADVATARGKPGAFVQSFAWATRGGLGVEDLSDPGAIADVAGRAYRAAGVKSLDKIDLIELVSRSSFEEIAVLDGLVAPLGGDARRLINSGATERGGSLPVNPSGGAGGAYLMQTAGLAAAVEVVRHLTGRAGPVQVPKARRGVAHGQSGPAFQSNAVVVLSAAPGRG